MAFHVPFNQRNRRPPVVYIGFEPQRRKRRQFNWWAFHGFWMTTLSIVLALNVHPAALLACPVALLASMKGLKKKPRKLATVSTIGSLAGSIVLGVGLFGLVTEQVHAKHMRSIRMQKAIEAREISESEAVIGSAIDELREYKADHDGDLPSWVDGNMLLLKHVDAWGNSLRFDAEEQQVTIRSAGPDTEYDTADDLTKIVKGESNRNVRSDVGL